VAFFLIAMSSGVLLAQSAPIKIGLWEKKMVMSGGSGVPETLTAKDCITPATWEQMLANASKQHAGCTINNVKTAHGYTFSGTCVSAHVNTSFKGSTTIQDSEHILSDTHMSMNMNGQTHQSDSHSISRYLGPDCGAIKPGDPEVE
jgi:hypothetical protein